MQRSCDQHSKLTTQHSPSQLPSAHLITLPRSVQQLYASSKLTCPSHSRAQRPPFPRWCTKSSSGPAWVRDDNFSAAPDCSPPSSSPSNTLPRRRHPARATRDRDAPLLPTRRAVGVPDVCRDRGLVRLLVERGGGPADEDVGAAEADRD